MLEQTVELGGLPCFHYFLLSFLSLFYRTFLLPFLCTSFRSFYLLHLSLFSLFLTSSFSLMLSVSLLISVFISVSFLLSLSLRLSVSLYPFPRPSKLLHLALEKSTQREFPCQVLVFGEQTGREQRMHALVWWWWWWYFSLTLYRRLLNVNSSTINVFTVQRFWP